MKSKTSALSVLPAVVFQTCDFHRPRWVVLALLALALGCGVHAAAPTVLPNHGTYFPGEEIVVSFAGGPGHPNDWVGVYPPDVEPNGNPPATIWNYVGGSQTQSEGLTEGSVTFPQGLNLAGDWAVYLLINDGYEKIATNAFSVVDPSSPLVRLGQRIYNVGDTIAITFTNGPANPKDWVGIYKEGETPGGPESTLWFYVDGTKDGITGKADGSLTFTGGLSAPGNYVAYFLVNDGYDILASETFNVTASASSLARVLFINPTDGSSNLPPVLDFSAAITNGVTKVVTNSVELKLDGSAVQATVTVKAGGLTVSYAADPLPASGSTHIWLLTARDNAVPANTIQAQSTITVGTYRNIVLPDPLYFDNFDAVTEGSLPAGWTQKSYTTPSSDAVDFGDLGSAAYGQWTAVNADRFRGSFVTYSDPSRDDAEKTDYRRVLSVNLFNVLNGKAYRDPLAKGRFLFGNSGYANGSASQVLYLFSPDFDLTGKTNVNLSFHSLWEQNQDSIAAIEYSTDKGSSWLPIAYFLDGPDIVTVTNEGTGQITIDAVTTFTAEQGDVAHYTDDDGNDIGGTYGAFIAAPITEALAPFIQARADDDPVESKRIELFRLPQADNQATVRFRFAHAGTDSWYFGIDDFGLYSIAGVPVEQPSITIALNGSIVVISWPATATGFVLESTPGLAPSNWQPVAGVSGNSYTVTQPSGTAFYRLKK